MKYPVDVVWPGNRRSGILTTEHPQNSRLSPVLLLIGGQPCRPAELMPRARIIVRWSRKSPGRAWSIIQQAIDAGYPVEIKPAEQRRL